MNKIGIQLYFEGANTSWVMDAEKIDDCLVMLGFEEHESDDEKEPAFKTEQILDKEDLELIKKFIDSVLSDAS